MRNSEFGMSFARCVNKRKKLMYGVPAFEGGGTVFKNVYF